MKQITRSFKIKTTEQLDNQAIIELCYQNRFVLEVKIEPTGYRPAVCTVTYGMLGVDMTDDQADEEHKRLLESLVIGTLTPREDGKLELNINKPAFDKMTETQKRHSDAIWGMFKQMGIIDEDSEPPY